MNPDPIDLYGAMYRIRRFEETVLDRFSDGVFFGTTHTALGQEANAVGVLSRLAPGDLVFSNHRCHGHFLAYGGSMHALFAELMGRSTGVCAGRGGSQHIHWKNFYASGVLGSTAPVAVGAALGEKYRGTGAVAVAFLGDGAFGEGVVYEALNLAALWAAPVLFVAENNHIAQTTPIQEHLAGEISARFQAFDIPVRELDTSDVLEILGAAEESLDEVRQRSAPGALILHTHRFGPHSKGDDTRSEDWLAQVRQARDPIRIHGARLEAGEQARVEASVDEDVQRAYQQALADPLPA
jgi:TPP-dependent pyruvate/acetoin dehydrogenase alpha subunit